MNVSLRPLDDRDLDTIYQHVTDPESIRMAAFTAEDQTDRRAFLNRMCRACGPHTVEVRRSRKRSCASTDVAGVLDRAPMTSGPQWCLSTIHVYGRRYYK
jgi:hypothetical protein